MILCDIWLTFAYCNSDIACHWNAKFTGCLHTLDTVIGVIKLYSKGSVWELGHLYIVDCCLSVQLQPPVRWWSRRHVRAKTCYRNLQWLSWSWSGPVMRLLLWVSSGNAQPITGQVTEVTCPVIGCAQPALTPSKRQNTGHVHAS